MVCLFGTKINDTTLKVGSTVYDINSLSEEYKATGYLVDNPAVEIQIDGKDISNTYYHFDTNSYTFDYIDHIKTDIDRLKDLEQHAADTDYILMINNLIQ